MFVRTTKVVSFTLISLPIQTYEMLNKIAVPSTHMIEEVEDLEERRSTLKGSMAAYFDRSGADELTASQLKSKWGFRDTLLIENQKIWQASSLLSYAMN